MVQGSINQFPSESLFLSPIISNLIFLLKIRKNTFNLALKLFS